MAHLAARPDAAARVAIFTDQRAELAALRESLPGAGMASPLAELGETLGRLVQRQQRVRRAITVAGAAALAVTAWLSPPSRTSRQTSA